MIQFVLLLLLINNIFGVKDDEKYREIILDQGIVVGEKFWNGDFYEFYGIPYAKAPTGRDKFKAPLPPEPWEGKLNANNNKILCPQTFYTGEETEEIFLAGEEDCLVINLLVPEVANQDNPLPVIVYIHSGAFAAGNGNMAKYHYLARHDVIVASFNFRLGAAGFACLGTEEIPGNAGMKDAVAALRWFNKNVNKFGGDPTKVTLAGFSVGATMAELLALSKSANGLVDKLVLESGSALSPYAINRHPIKTATGIARSIGYNGTGDIKSLNEFYLDASPDLLAAKSLNFFLPNSTFGFAPCIEQEHDKEPFLTESPLNIMKRGEYPEIAILTGFANMEGISRALKFDEWSEQMNYYFEKFLPADLIFKDKTSRNEVVKSLQNYYFKGEEVSHDTIQNYIDYFSDSMFKYPIMKSALIHAKRLKRPVYVYEFAFVGELSMKHNFMDIIKGASHRDQSSYILDFYTFTKNVNDLDMRDRMTFMWSDFVKFENPTAYESLIINYKWPKYTDQKQNYLLIKVESEVKRDVFVDEYKYWDNIYEKYYWSPSAK